jgi:excisionase family DNA binding protein
MRDHLLLPREVAELFGVTPGTVTRWANEGRLPSLQTPGGRHRFRRSEINALRPAATDRPAESAPRLDARRRARSGSMAG